MRRNFVLVFIKKRDTTWLKPQLGFKRKYRIMICFTVANGEQTTVAFDFYGGYRYDHLSASLSLSQPRVTAKSFKKYLRAI